MPGTRRSRIFLTHSWSDIKFARRLFQDLKNRGFEVWFDDKEVRGGERLAEEINAGLEWCDVYIPILSRDSLESPWCREEINAAITLGNKPERRGRPKIVSVLVEDCQDKMPVLLQARLYIAFTGNYPGFFQELVQKGLGVQTGARSKLAVQPLALPAKARLPLLILGALALLILVAGGIFIVLNPAGGASASPTAPLVAALTPTVALKPPSTSTPRASETTLPITSTRVPAPTGLIAFGKNEGDRPENKSIWTMNVDGSGAKKILDRASQPAFSPDGKKIAYFRWIEGLYIANVDGAAAVKLLGDNSVLATDWSRDGKWIAYATQPGGKGDISIHVVGIDGTNQRRIASGESPAWSPDSALLAFRSCRAASCGIFKTSAAGGDALAITLDDGGLPAWSPAGNRIVYQKEVAGEKQLFIVNADGSGTQQLTSGAAMHVSANWSSDGNFIFYRSPEGGAWGIWRMNADGTNAIKLIDNVEPVNWLWERLAYTR